jgi:protoheme IX farnesyltransferase
MALTRFAKYVWFLLAYNLAAVSWGVYVRASGSGDGCGSHWPLCDGNSTPLGGQVAKYVEMSHRISTEIVGLFVVIMVVWAYRIFPKRHLARGASLAALFMTTLEAFIGRELVAFQLVTNNPSPVRAGVMSFHVISTFLLLGAIAVTGFAAGGLNRIKLRDQGAVGTPLLVGALGMILLGLSGAVSALGHTLRPVDNVLGAALNSNTFWMVRVQPLHPLVAVAVGLYLALIAGLISHLRPDPRVRIAGQWMIGLYGLQLLIGLVNIWTKAPIAVQMLHLSIADLNWVSLVAMSVYALQADVEKVELRPAPESTGNVQKPAGRELVNAYIALTKPRVISLLLFTALAASIAAEGSWPGIRIFLAVAVGGYMVAGAANVINMVIDRDIDLIMKRTSTRPTVTQSISSSHALAFSFVLAFGAFAILWSQTNLLAAVMALCGLVFYVIVYTMLLKRRTWQNIVIGGAAGSFPPLVGWAAVTNDLPPLALYLFAIIFVWTPVHFWALALMLKEEYAAAGVPMLPVVKGDRITVHQISAYTALTIVVTMLPFALPRVGWIYAGAAVVLNVILVQRCVRLNQKIDKPRASSLFHYSMLYLALLFTGFAVDRMVVANTSSRSAKVGTLSVRLLSAPRTEDQKVPSFVAAAQLAANRLPREEAAPGANSLKFSELR